MQNINELLNDTFTNTGLWGALISAIGIIFIGWLLVKVKILKQDWKNALIAIVLYVAYPAVIVKSFMTTTYPKDFDIQKMTIIFSISFYIAGCLLYILWKKVILEKFILTRTKKYLLGEEEQKNRKDRNLNMWMMGIFGSTVFFGSPIISAIYGEEGMLTQIIWNTPFTLMLTGFCQAQYLGIKFKRKNYKQVLKMFLSPVVITSILFLVLWISQLIPGSYIFNTIGRFNKETYDQGIWWLDLKYTAPFLYKIIDVVSMLCSPLIWIAIGMSIKGTKILTLLKDKDIWLFNTIKLIIIPLMVMLIIGGLGLINNCYNNSNLTIIVILMATPPATICVAYSIKSNRDINFAANASIFTTLLTPILIPIWIAISELYTNSINLI